MAITITLEQTKYVLLGGAGMWMLLSFTGHPMEYWHVITGAWAYGLIGAWIGYPEAFSTAMAPA